MSQRRFKPKCIAYLAPLGTVWTIAVVGGSIFVMSRYIDVTSLHPALAAVCGFGTAFLAMLGLLMVDFVLGYDRGKLDFACAGYRDGLFSTGKGAELAGLYYDEFLNELQKRKIPLRFGPSSIAEAEAEERNLIRQLKKGKSESND